MPPPAGRDGARPLQGARSRAVYGGVRLGCGFRQPNSETEFGASVMVTPPYGCNAGGSQRKADVGIGPYEKERKFHQPPGPAAHSGASAPAGARKWVGIAAKIIPKGAINLGQSLSQPAADSSLCTREPWGRGMRISVTSAPNFGTKFGWRWLRPRRVGPLGLLAITMVSCHSEERSDVGIRSLLRWTGVRAAEVVGPYAPRGTGERHAGVVVPYGWSQGGLINCRGSA